MQTKPTPYDFLAPANAIVRGNVTIQVTDALRSSIVSLVLKPGEVIDKTAICERLGVSRFPVSEALARLQAEGLVEIQPQRGTTVSLVKLADVEEYMLIRKAIEAEAVQALVKMEIPDLMEHLNNSISDQRTSSKIGDAPTFIKQDYEFHELLFGAMHFVKVKMIIDGVRANIDRARMLVSTPRRLATTMGEHEAIVDAIAVNDAELAAAAMRAHIDEVMKEILSFAQLAPHLFADGETFFSNR